MERGHVLPPSRPDVMAPFAQLLSLSLLLGVTPPAALAMTVNCAPTKTSEDSHISWIQSWMPPVLQDQFSVSSRTRRTPVSPEASPGERARANVEDHWGRRGKPCVLSPLISVLVHQVRNISDTLFSSFSVCTAIYSSSSREPDLAVKVGIK